MMRVSVWTICGVSIIVLLLFVSGMRLLLEQRLGFGVVGLQAFQVLVEAVEALLPEPAVVVEPVEGALQLPGFQPRRTPLRIAAAGDEAGLLQNFEVLRNRRLADLEGFGKLFDRGLAGSEAGQDRAPGGVGESGKGGAEGVIRH